MLIDALFAKIKLVSSSLFFQDILLDTWDSGEEADVTAFMSAMTRDNVNNVTKENAWTPLMILSGLGSAKGIGGALKKMKDLGANAEKQDKEGWNALHWVNTFIILRLILSILSLVKWILRVIIISLTRTGSFPR